VVAVPAPSVTIQKSRGIGRNPLKTPESDEGIQGNPRILSLDSLPFSLVFF
jgi:hypothetical protein